MIFTFTRIKNTLVASSSVNRPASILMDCRSTPVPATASQNSVNQTRHMTSDISLASQDVTTTHCRMGSRRERRVFGPHTARSSRSNGGCGDRQLYAPHLGKGEHPSAYPPGCHALAASTCTDMTSQTMTTLVGGVAFYICNSSHTHSYSNSMPSLPFVTWVAIVYFSAAFTFSRQFDRHRLSIH